VDIKRNFSMALALGGLVGAGSLVGCKTPIGGGLGLFNKDDASVASSSPDVGRQKYDLLAKEFGAGGAPTRGMGGVADTDEGFLASRWKKATAAVSSAFASKPQPATDDPTSLSSKPGKIGAEPHIAAARLLENQNKLPEALEQYERALKTEPNNLTALVSLARLHDRQGKGPLALEVYERAIKAHPKSALVHNDMGLCFARQQQWPRATQSLNQAIALQPANPKYRNNLATVLVEMGRADEALKQLTAVNPPAVAHYNLAYLLAQKGQQDLAIAHLQQAVARDPNLGPAQDMLAQLSGAGAEATPPTQPDPRLAAQQISTPLYRTGPAPEQPAQQPTTQPPTTQPPTTQPPVQSIYGGGSSYSISDEASSTHPSGSSTPVYGGTSWGSPQEASPAPVSGIEPLPPVE
jgi:tetratricopeptide (TPR) repeat protein